MYKLSIQESDKTGGSVQNMHQTGGLRGHKSLSCLYVPKLPLLTRKAFCHRHTAGRVYTYVGVNNYAEIFFFPLRPSLLLFNWIQQIFKIIQCLFKSAEDLSDGCGLGSQSNEIISPGFL